MRNEFLEARAPVRRIENRWLIQRMAFLAAAFLALNILAGEFYFVVPGNVYTTVHLVMEFVGVVVAVSVSLMSWYDYRYKGEAGALILSGSFIVVGVLELAHTLSYFGMPDFISPNSVNKASTFWIMVRIVQAVGILSAVLAGTRLCRIRRPGLLPFIFTLAAVVIVYLTAVGLEYLPPMYDVVKKAQTPLKIGMEYVVMAVMLAAVVLIFKKKEKDSRHFYLIAALLVGIMSGIAFTLYSSAYDAYNLLGHVYLVISYALILKALLEEALAGVYQSNLELERKSSELAEANRQLQAADKLKNDFLANTNHELKTPLSAIVAFTELLLDEKNTGTLNDLQKDYLKEIGDSGRTLQAKIGGLLYLTALFGGKTVLHLEVISLKGLVYSVVESYRKTFLQKGVSLEASFEGDHTIWGDREKISRILINLLDNALKFTDPGGSVEVRTGLYAEKNEAWFSVKDTGIGIDASQRDHIYKLFYQVDGASTRKYGGTGIGLTLAAKLVEMHKGRIELDSECGRGSKFTVILPVSGPRR